MKRYKIYEYNKHNNVIGAEIREVNEISKLNSIGSNEIAFLCYIEIIPAQTLKSIELCYKIIVPIDIKLELYMKSNGNKYVSFILNEIRYMYILLEEYEQKNIKTEAYYQIKRLQDELLSMSITAGYSRDYLTRKLGTEYDEIMIDNKGLKWDITQH